MLGQRTREAALPSTIRHHRCVPATHVSGVHRVGTGADPDDRDVSGLHHGGGENTGCGGCCHRCHCCVWRSKTGSNTLGWPVTLAFGGGWHWPFGGWAGQAAQHCERLHQQLSVPIRATVGGEQQVEHWMKDVLGVSMKFWPENKVYWANQRAIAAQRRRQQRRQQRQAMSEEEKRQQQVQRARDRERDPCFHSLVINFPKPFFKMTAIRGQRGQRVSAAAAIVVAAERVACTAYHSREYSSLRQLLPTGGCFCPPLPPSFPRPPRARPRSGCGGRRAEPHRAERPPFPRPHRRLPRLLLPPAHA